MLAISEAVLNFLLLLTGRSALLSHIKLHQLQQELS